MDEITELKKLAPKVQRCDEGGVTFYLLPQLALPSGCTPERVDALLCPTPRDGYPSRLFFDEQVRASGNQNWNGAARILERNWYAYSWMVPEPGLRLAQIVMAHLRALR